MVAAIDMSGVKKSFAVPGAERVHALRGIDFAIEPGEIVALLGPNGAGKTTALDIILGLTKPDSGTASLFGGQPRSAVEAGRVAAVLQTGGLLADLRVGETVRMIASLYPGQADVDGVLDRAGITGIAARRVSRCSGGQQQRLRFALALLPDPDVMILDEPTAGMDVESRRDFWDTMRADAERGRTVVFATHYLEEADAFADRVILLAAGQVIADGSTARIRALATGRTVSAQMSDQSLESLKASTTAVGGMERIDVRGGRVYIRATDSDAVARYLLANTDARDLEIVSTNLEDAFVSLTSGQASGDAQ